MSAFRMTVVCVGAALSVSGCKQLIEGQFAGECIDGADNDVDGFFDCDDPDCINSPVCEDDAIVNKETDPPDTDLPPDTDDTDVVQTNGWVDCDVPADGEDDRPEEAGPHDVEYEKVTAWLILPETGTTEFDSNCTTTGGDWQAVFEQPSFPPTGYNYTFYTPHTGGVKATKQNCASGYPDGCQNDEVVYDVFNHRLTAQFDEEVVSLEGLCTMVIDSGYEIVDEGCTGDFLTRIEISYTGDCFGQDVNNGCEAVHSFDVEFAAAR